MGQPLIIQGGMGIAVSGWKLARQVSLLGELGVVSGTAMTSVLVRRLQDGDPDGQMREALAHFPAPEIAQEILQTYFLPEGREPGSPYKLCPMYSLPPSLALDRLTVVACFAEVYAAKQGHQGLVGINLLEKIQLPNLASLYGAMLAGVDYVIMGAGIPREIPGVLDRFASQQEASLRIVVLDSTGDVDHRITFDPKRVIPMQEHAPLRRPQFLAVISSVALAGSLAKKATGHVDGFVVENNTAGGHNAPPRGPMHLSDQGEPIYGTKDEVNLRALAELGRPFWLAGAFATPEKLRAAVAAGASGIQVGTMFAFAKESGVSASFKEVVRKMAVNNEKPVVFTDPLASPSGFPFKVVRLADTMSEAEVYGARPRRCDLGYLRMPYLRGDGKLDYRCASEPVDAYLKKGGTLQETEGRKCLCNGLLATVDLPQHRKEGYTEPALITAGDDLAEINRWLGADGYSASDVIRYLRGSAEGKPS